MNRTIFGRWCHVVMYVGLTCMLVSLVTAGAAELPRDGATISMDTPRVPPRWALMERRLLKENERAVDLYFNRYWDERGWFKCRETWGIGKGSDDVLQATANFPLLYALGADRSVLDFYYRAYRGHLEQFTTAEVEAVPPWGIFYKGFVAANDSHHHAEQYASFNQLPVADPANDRFAELAVRFGGFYLNEGLPDGAEPNYDSRHHIIRSMVHGSRGARLEIDPAFWGYKWKELGRRERFRHWTKVKGDWPKNLGMTTFVANAYFHTGEDRYRDWVLDYVGGWIERAKANDGIFPANCGLNGEVGEHWDGAWWRHVHGNWRLFREIVGGIENAILVSGDPSHADALRLQVQALLERAVEKDGAKYPPRSFDGEEWSGQQRLGRLLARMYLAQFRPADLRLIEEEVNRWGSAEEFDYGGGFFYFANHLAWIYYLEGWNSEFPREIAGADLGRIRRKVAQIRSDDSVDWERSTDATHRLIPVATHALINLTCGGMGQNNSKGTYPIMAQVWHYDPARNRPGLPPDVGALVDGVGPEEVSLQLVNLSQTEPRTVVVRTGAYGEHQCVKVRHGGRWTEVDDDWFAVRLAPGSGGRLTLQVDRYANRPRAALPWEPQE